MIVDRAIVKGLVEPITERLVDFGSKSRYFTTFDSVQQSYISLDSETLVTDGGSITFFIWSSDSASAEMIVGNTGTVNNCIFQNGSSLTFRDSTGVNVITSSSSLEENKLNKVVGVINSGILTVEVNGVQVGSGSFSDLSFNLIGTRVSGQFFFNGIISQVSVRHSGETVFNMPISGNYSPINNAVIDTAGGNNGTFVNVADGDSELYTLRSDGNYEGENLITQEIWENPDVLFGGGWTYDDVANTWSLNGDGSLQFIQLLFNSSQPEFFVVRGYVLSVSGELAVVSALTQFIDEAGFYEVIGSQSIDGPQQYKRVSGTVNAEISKPELRAFLEVAY